MTAILSEADRKFFEAEGYLIVKGFYDVTNEITPIQKDIYDIIGLVAERHGEVLNRPRFSPEQFDAGYNTLIARNRNYGGEIYDLVKQIPAFLRLICNERSDALFRSLRNTTHSGIGAESYGIRIDVPYEDKFRSHWHQEFMFQPQSIDGIVFWTPLLPVSAEYGPVIVLPKSHRDGLCVYSRGANYADKQGAYQIGLHDEDEIIRKYEQAAPLTEPGDLLLMDFLTIHGSGVNRAGRARWSVQSRFFNYRDPVGQKIGWKASVTSGTDVAQVFPDHFIET
ncbi:phytanoyl-CoA dioxygenase family protein [uncultured Ruegeria sp.]|uniref:phytanoyl-CoA dioxygenase family protein n=1 Tax=uncultured Ruegeria sp. TaxID=259304 RepID=UPI002621D52D|nr:phytanoyl-CoA dioxygenase family protein [uncultured Ruegeria sp.]